jgi:outer membrane protein
LAELVDAAESHNPETRMAWERARAQAAVLGIARSEFYPILAAAALSNTRRQDVYLQTRFYRQTIQDFEAALELNYTVFDFGGWSGRINAAKAEVLAANFAFNDVHRQIIYQVERAYYQLLNASGQEDSARASFLCKKNFYIIRMLPNLSGCEFIRTPHQAGSFSLQLGRGSLRSERSSG